MTPAQPPLVGLSVGRRRASFGPWDLVADVADARYVDCVLAAGGLPVLLSLGISADAAGQLVSRLDALVVTGGPDVDARRYDANPHPAADPPDLQRDAFEAALLQEALASGLPVVTICRGTSCSMSSPGARSSSTWRRQGPHHVTTTSPGSSAMSR
ncbi:hypothetical protein GCM10027062_35210 [Nocardioides hungaricus]